MLPESTVNPVAVEVQTSGVAVGTVVQVIVSPAAGAAVSVDSTPLAGTTADAVATADVTLPLGASVVTATVNFSPSSAASAALAPLLGGEALARLELRTHLGGGIKRYAITTSGRAVSVPGALTWTN